MYWPNGNNFFENAPLESDLAGYHDNLCLMYENMVFLGFLEVVAMECSSIPRPELPELPRRICKRRLDCNKVLVCS
jgi:hypothetical protein